MKDLLQYYIAEGFMQLMYCKVDQSGSYSEDIVLFRLVVPEDKYIPTVTDTPGGAMCLTWGKHTYVMDKATIMRYGAEYSSEEEMITIDKQWRTDTNEFSALFRKLIEPELKPKENE